MRRKYLLLFAPLSALIFIITASLFFPACKSKPVPIPPHIETKMPSAYLVFERVEAGGPERLTLIFSLEIENPFPLAGQAKIESWRAEINGQKINPGSGLVLENPASADYFQINAETSSSFPLRLVMDMDALAAGGHAPFDEYEVKLIAELDISAGINSAEAHSARLEVSGLAAFPGVQVPTFRITAIAILKAELVNTRFRVSMKIDNPNPYPVELSAFRFELHGNGRLWADGTERNIIRIPAKYSVEGNLFLMMNFIDMSRALLDQIIMLEDVNYRFAGEAEVSTGVEYLPKFNTAFDLSGYSRVLEN
jgi:LEA14-like dessication related protein